MSDTASIWHQYGHGNQNANGENGIVDEQGFSPAVVGFDAVVRVLLGHVVRCG